MLVVVVTDKNSEFEQEIDVARKSFGLIAVLASKKEWRDYVIEKMQWKLSRLKWTKSLSQHLNWL